MKKYYLTLFLSFMFLGAVSGQNDEFNTSDLLKVAKIVDFEFVKKFKDVSEHGLIQVFNTIESDRNLIKQININSWAVCEHYNIDNFDTYNYYYKIITREQYNKYCKELNALMLIDGTITQLK